MSGRSRSRVRIVLAESQGDTRGIVRCRTHFGELIGLLRPRHVSSRLCTVASGAASRRGEAARIKAYFANRQLSVALERASSHVLENESYLDACII